MKKLLKFLALVLILAALVCGVLAYLNYRERTFLDNYPYEPDTPAPDPHDGTFVSEHGTMVFNGDGESVTIVFDSKLSELTGLPQGETEATYVFLSGDLPPHGSIDVRYDIAHELQINAGDTSVVIDLGDAAEDGSTATVGVGTVTEERIPLLFRIDGKSVTVAFEKE